jgi:hypothetical protein
VIPVLDDLGDFGGARQVVEWVICLLSSLILLVINANVGATRWQQRATETAGENRVGVQLEVEHQEVPMLGNQGAQIIGHVLHGRDQDLPIPHLAAETMNTNPGAEVGDLHQTTPY